MGEPVYTSLSEKFPCFWGDVFDKMATADNWLKTLSGNGMHMVTQWCFQFYCLSRLSKKVGPQPSSTSSA
eukprot:3662931-Pyramimonas_sp.AAC.1